jgi:hypothetical protein
MYFLDPKIRDLETRLKRRESEESPSLPALETPPLLPAPACLQSPRPLPEAGGGEQVCAGVTRAGIPPAPGVQVDARGGVGGGAAGRVSNPGAHAQQVLQHVAEAAELGEGREGKGQ